MFTLASVDAIYGSIEQTNSTLALGNGLSLI